MELQGFSNGSNYSPIMTEESVIKSSDCEKLHRH